MIEIERKQILVDGRPRILLCGEVHYFRLERDAWSDRLTKLAEAGCDTVASYIPWLCHELSDRSFDLTGRSRPALDLGGFIDLCAETGLSFLARPGPFVMAEMKNEGLPYRLYTEHPEIHPVTWDGETVSTRTVDYLAPAFLVEVRGWYDAVMPVLASRLVTRGGNVLGVQLDNEVGMLSWVSGSPDLTDHVLGDLARWLRERYDASTLAERYPFSLDDETTRAARFRSPEEPYALAFMHDLGVYMRDRFARYVRELRTYAEANDVRDVPFVVNVHGTGGGRGTEFPIGISQLMESYEGVDGMLSGSDHYLGDLTTRNAVDLHLINAFMDAVHDADQPLTSVEFEAGDGDYGRDLTHAHDPSTVALKTRLCVAQGNRLLNYYLFTGGVNYRLDAPVGDGNDRISFTGEYHGTGAPLDPDGRANLTYPGLVEVLHAVRAVEPWLATMDEERDDVVIGFVPDYFMTESVYRGSGRMRELVSNLERYRFGGPGEIMARSMLLSGYRFGAVNLQNRAPDPSTTPAVALGSARYLAADVQQGLADYLRTGGRLLLCGELPTYDMEGRPCTILADALGLAPTDVRHGDHRYFLSVCASGWAAPRPEVRVSYAQLFEQPPSKGTVLLYDYDSGAGCGFDIRVGAGRAILVTTDYPGNDVDFYREALEALDIRAGIQHQPASARVFVTSTANESGERLLHVLNLDGYPKDLTFTEHGKPLFDGASVHLEPRQGLMLPINLRINERTLAYATGEITGWDGDSPRFSTASPVWH